MHIQSALSLIAEYDGEPKGMRPMDAHTLLIADGKSGLMRLDIASAASSPGWSAATASASRA